MNFTPAEMIEAQRIARSVLHASDKDHLLTPDALAALLRERDELKQQRDQWREVAEALAHAMSGTEILAAHKRFDALKAMEGGK